MAQPIRIPLAITACLAWGCTVQLAPPAGQPGVQAIGAVGSPSPAGPATPLPPLDDPGQNPYRAPDFKSLPPEAEAGRWEPIRLSAQPLATPTPTPVPTPTPLPGLEGGGMPYIEFGRQDAVLNLGETRRFSAFGYAPGEDRAPVSWGVLESDRARITADGELTALAPGPIHAYAQIGARRRYLLAAAVDPSLAIQRVGPQGYLSGAPSQWQSWGTLIRSQAEWAAFKARFVAPVSEQFSAGPIDFSKQTVVVINHYSTSDTAPAPVVTRIRRDGGTVVEAVVPDVPPGVCHCDPHELITVVAVPLLPADTTIELVSLRETEVLSPTPVTGPTPTPSPSPTPTPDPFQSLPAGSPTRPPAPPYPPPSLSQAGDCFGPNPFDAMRPQPFYLSWFEPGLMNASNWEPILTPGSSFRLFVSGGAPAMRWHVSDPRLAEVSNDGTLTGRRAGVVMVTAENDSATQRALIPVMEQPAPALRFRFRADWDIPNDRAQRGPRIIRDAAAWESLWKRDLFYTLPWSPPQVDFARYDVVAVVDDRLSSGESAPIISHISNDASLVHVVFPGIYSGSASYRRAIYVFLTGKLAPQATVRVHTLCNP